MFSILEILAEWAAVGFAFGLGMFLAAEFFTIVKSLISAWIITRYMKKSTNVRKEAYKEVISKLKKSK